jgi:hypothetical protein
MTVKMEIASARHTLESKVGLKKHRKYLNCRGILNGPYDGQATVIRW